MLFRKVFITLLVIVLAPFLFGLDAIVEGHWPNSALGDFDLDFDDVLPEYVIVTPVLLREGFVRTVMSFAPLLLFASSVRPPA